MFSFNNDQRRFSNLKILNSHKERMDRLSLLDIANKFTDHNLKTYGSRSFSVVASTLWNALPYEVIGATSRYFESFLASWRIAFKYNKTSK